MPTAPSAQLCCFSPPGASFQPGWHLTLTPCLESFPACTSWRWMRHSTAGEWPCFLELLFHFFLSSSEFVLDLSTTNHCSVHFDYFVLIRSSLELRSVPKNTVTSYLSTASPRGLGRWQCPTSCCSRGPNPWLASTTQTEHWRCSPPLS